MKPKSTILILGGGTAGTIIANKLRRVLPSSEYRLVVVDQDETHYYQPGFLLIPFGLYQPQDAVRQKKSLFRRDIEVLVSRIEKIEPRQNFVLLENGVTVPYNYLVIATGVTIRPEEIEGMKEKLWYQSIFDFYTIEGATALGELFRKWSGGKLVVHVAEMPIKCPVAPLEFLFLADDFFRKRGIRQNVEIEYVTPLSGAFTKPEASRLLGETLKNRNISVITDFNIARVDNGTKKIISWDDREILFDVLVTVPTNKGDEAIARSDMGNELNLVPTDKQTLRALDYDNIFVIGDAADLPSSKAGSTAHFQSEILVENMLSLINNQPVEALFDGHANCFIESGNGKAFLIDFNYETEPLRGTYPIPLLGPLSLLKETRFNHYAKLLFRWIYWNLLLKGVKLPIPSRMSMAGKRV